MATMATLGIEWRHVMRAVLRRLAPHASINQRLLPQLQVIVQVLVVIVMRLYLDFFDLFASRVISILETDRNSLPEFFIDNIQVEPLVHS
jgi:hypothetical protein